MDKKIKCQLQSPVFSWKNKVVRVMWGCVYHTVFRFSPTPFFGFRRIVLRAFGAKVGVNVNVYSSARIWLPANLIVNDGASIGPEVDIYNQGMIIIGRNAIVSQKAYLCASTHDYNDPLHPLVLAPICIESDVWICAGSFVGPGVLVSRGAILGAKGVLTQDAKAWGIYAGNPALHIKDRNKARFIPE